MTAPTLMIMAGGTGGHVMPGLAVARTMRERGWHVVWMGNPTGMEATLVPRHDIRLLPVRFGGLRGKGLRTRLTLPLNLLRACWQAWRALRAARPAVVLGMGGYIAFPGGVMAALTRIPLVVHEQNSVAGLTNRALARLADRVLTAFPDTLPGAAWCGNPVREEIVDAPEPSRRFSGRSGPLRLLVVGGSLGARALNEALPRALALIPADLRPVVTHQCGAANRVALEAAYRAVDVDATVAEFIDDMARAYADADLVICRAGAMTVSELAAIGAASVLVPFPHAVDDHQTGNARFLSDRDAAVLLPQQQLSPDGLATLLRGFTRERLLRMADNARRAARPDASKLVADACESIART